MRWLAISVIASVAACTAEPQLVLDAGTGLDDLGQLQQGVGGHAGRLREPCPTMEDEPGHQSLLPSCRFARLARPAQ